MSGSDEVEANAGERWFAVPADMLAAASAACNQIRKLVDGEVAGTVFAALNMYVNVEAVVVHMDYPIGTVFNAGDEVFFEFNPDIGRSAS